MDQPNSRLSFEVAAAEEAEGTRFTVTASDGQTRHYHLNGSEHPHYLEFFAELAEDFGTRVPGSVEAPTCEQGEMKWRPLITENLSPRTLYGYGDPAVLRTDDGWILTATTSDAPDAFPIVHSPDLQHWEHRGFIFPEGQTPAWAAVGRHVADFWAPEIARVGEEYWVAYTARQQSNALAIGLARAPTPEGPWEDNGEPLITGGRVLYPGTAASGGVIDSHIFVDDDGTAYLFWKNDTNGLWPRPLAGLLSEHSDLIDSLFESAVDRRTAAPPHSLPPYSPGPIAAARWSAFS